MNKVDEIHTKIREARDMAKAHAAEATDPKCKELCEHSSKVLAELEEQYDKYLHEAK